MLMAFSWWSVLLYTKNKDAFVAKAEYMKILMVAEGSINNEVDFLQAAAYQDLAKKYKRQEWMILGEAIVFIISLIIGVWLINRGYNKEIVAANQQRNFLLSITHELKSPLSSIRLILETFQKRELNTAQKEKFTRSALQETDRLTTLVNDLLLAAKIETTYQPSKEPIPLTESLEDIVSKLKMKYPEAGFMVKSEPQDIFIEGDRLGITSTLINLLENALKYSPKPAIIEAIVKANDQNIIIEIADQGHGIRDKEKKKVFEKFYRIGSEDTRETKGTGLGLFIVNEIIKAHRGKIVILDNKPKGTRFRIILPAESRFQEEIDI
ncbi:MAG: two-component system phosphate regulon sensor histidine kinase PhoR [Saprospiraceae bacterium]|jgi:two-component system phosphate regulon sensor histidine kinase PhoR